MFSPKWEPDPSTSDFPSGGITPSAALIRAPRLGDIEQFNSTETQTESNAVANHTAADDWDSITAEFGLRQFMEAETQFDIDDILCSNYTQTRYARKLDQREKSQVSYKSIGSTMHPLQVLADSVGTDGRTFNFGGVFSTSVDHVHTDPI